ncbi:MAG TPA: type 4a pilus biogenesis protein PilO [Tepidisphaeraceae bacterium]|jgi:Tfp pilus assembly protein PilO
MNRELKQQRFAIDALGAISCALIVTVIYLVGFGPILRQKQTASGLHRQLAVQRQRVATAQAGVRQLKQQISVLNALVSKEAINPAQALHSNARLQEITSLAAARGLTIKGVEPGLARQELHYQAMPLRLRGNGTYSGCVLFLHDLRRMLRDTTLTGFSLTGSPETAGSPVTFDLDLCWYAVPTVASVQEH